MISSFYARFRFSGLFLVLTIAVAGFGTAVVQAQPPGTLKWSYRTGPDIVGSPAISPDGSTLYIGSQDGVFYAIGTSSGVASWTFRATKSIENRIIGSPAVAADGTVYFGAGDWLYALNPAGNLKWSNTTYAFDVGLPGTIYSSPSITTDGRIVVAGQQDQRVYIFNPNGTFSGSTNGVGFPSSFISSAAIGYDNTIYFGGLDGRLYPLGIGNKTPWTGLTGGPINASPSIGPDGTIYVGSVDNKLHAFAPDGTKRWEFQTGDAIYASPVVGMDGTIYVGSYDRKFYAVSPSGSLIWSFTADGFIHGSAAIAADGTIYVPSDVGGSQGRLIALDSQGRKMWEFNTPEQIHASPTIGPDGTVYVGSLDDTLYAIRGTVGPAQSSWPMQGRTVARPGRVNVEVKISEPRPGRAFPAPARVNVVPSLAFAPGSVPVNIEYYLGNNFVAREGIFPFTTILDIPQTNRYQVQIKATVRNQDGSVDSVFSAPVSFAVVTNRFGPVVSSIPDQTTSRQAQIPFTVSDAESPPEELFGVVVSDNGALIPPDAIQVIGASTNRTLVVTPRLNSIPVGGIKTRITVTYFDGDRADSSTKSGSTSFSLTVLPPTNPPDIALEEQNVTLAEDSTEIDGAPRRVFFGVFDQEDPDSALVVTAASLDPVLFPPANITIGGSGLNSFVDFYPGTNQFGSSVIRLTVRDRSGETNFADLHVTVTPRDDAPVLSTIENVVLAENETSKRIFLTVRDVDSDITAIKLLVRNNSNAALLPPGSIVFDGTGNSRSFIVKPAAGKSGVAVVGIVATEGLISSRESIPATFTVTVNQQNSPPTISVGSPSVTTFEDTSTVPIPITVGDKETPVENLIVSVTTTNLALIPPSSIRLEGSGATRRLFLTPATNQFGTTLVQLTVNDSQGATNSTSFVLVVTPLNDQPFLSEIPDLILDEDSVSNPVPFTVRDVETAASDLQLSVKSSNPFLVPSGGVTFKSLDGTNRTFTVRPSPDASGVAVLTLTLTDEGAGTVSRDFKITVNPINDPPVLSGPQSLLKLTEDQPFQLPVVTATDADAGTNFLRLVLTPGHGRVRFIVSNGLVFEAGTTNGGSSMQVLADLPSLNTALASTVFFPETNYFGLASVELILDDLGNSGSGGIRTAALSLNLDISPVNDLPVLSAIPDVTLDLNSVSPLIPFTVTDVETPSNLLKLEILSSDPVLLPPNGIEFLAVGSDRALRLTPATGRTGSADLRFVVTDQAGGAVTNSFKLVVQQVKFPPTLTIQSGLNLAEDAPGGSGPIPITVADQDTPLNLLTLSALSSDTNLVDASGLVFGGSGASRTLVVTPKPDRFGSAVISVLVSDGEFTNKAALNLVVTPVNDPPTLGSIPGIQILEDSGLQKIQLSGISPGPANENQTVTLAAFSSDTSIIPTPSVSYLSGSTTASLEFSPATNAFGSAVLGVVVSDGIDRITNSFSVVVKPVNDAPSFLKGTNIAVLQNAGPQSVQGWASAISVGPTNESSQAASFEVIPADPAFFSALPTIDSSGLLRFTLAPGSTGTTLVNTRLLDDGGIADGGTNASPFSSFSITATPVNSAPSFVAGPDITVLEDSGAANFPAWATSISAGPAGESSQQVVFLVTNSAPALFLNRPGVARDGTLSFTPAPNAYGQAVISVRLKDDGGTANGGVDISVEKTFVINILPVNDTPTVDPIPDLTIDEDSGQTGVELRNLGFGPLNESQTLTLTAVSSDHQLLPDPEIRFNGPDRASLILLPNTNRFGSALITLTLRDNGGTNNGGIDFAVQTFTLTVLPVDDPPIIGPVADQSTTEGVPTLAIPVSVFDIDTPAEKLVVTATSPDSTLVPSDGIKFSGTGPLRLLTLTPSPGAAGTARVIISVTDGTSTNQTSFNLLVRASDKPPRLAGLHDVNLNEDAIGFSLPFSISDPDSSIATLTLTVSSSDAGLLPPAGLILAPTTTTPGETNWVLKITPSPDRSGQARLTVSLKDLNTTVSEEISVQVQPLNDAPSFVGGGDVVVLEDSGPIVRSGWASAIKPGPADESGQLMKFVLTNSAPELFFEQPSIGIDGTLRFTPATNAFGLANVSAVLVDDGGKANGGEDRSPERLFTIRINPVNDAPTVNQINNLSRDEDSGLFTLVFSGVGPGATNELQNLTITASSSNPSILPDPVVVYTSPAATGRLVFTPATNATGTATITLTIKDDGGVTDGGRDTTVQSFTLRLDPVNDAPAIADIGPQSTPENTASQPIRILVSDIDTDVTRLLLKANSSNTALIPDENLKLEGTGAIRTLVATPALNQTGDSIITVVVSDGALTATNRFVLNVISVNQPPLISAIADQSMAEDEVLPVRFVVSDRESPPDQLVITASVNKPALIPSAGLQISGAGTNRVLTISLVPNASGEAIVDLVVSDGRLFATNSFKLLVRPVNDPPTIGQISPKTTLENTPSEAISIALADVDTPLEQVGLTATSSDPALVPASGLRLTGSGPFRSLVITPALNKVGFATISIIADDGAARVTNQFSFTVQLVNQPPVLGQIPDQIMLEDGTISVPFVAFDRETPANQLLLSLDSSNSQLVGRDGISFGGTGTNRTLVIQPSRNLSGTTQLQLKVSDGELSTTNLFKLTVRPVNDAPSFVPGTDVIVLEDSGRQSFKWATVISAGPADESTQQLRFSTTNNLASLFAEQPAIASDGTLSFVPAGNAFGTATVKVVLIDGGGTADGGVDSSPEISFKITVSPVNDPPTLNSLNNLSRDEDSGIFTLVLSGISPGPANEVQNLTVTAVSSDTSIVPNPAVNYVSPSANARLTFTPATNATGTATITVTVRDDGGASDGGRDSLQRVFTLRLDPVNDAPLLVAPGSLSINENTATGPISVTLSDVDNSPDQLTLSATSGNQTLVPDSGIQLAGTGAVRTLVIRPAAGQTGQAVINLVVNDGFLSATRQLVLTVVSVDQPPSISGLQDRVTDEDLPLQFEFNVSDRETPPDQLRLFVSASNPALVASTNLVLSGNGSTRSLQIIPSANMSGQSVIQMILSDARFSVTNQFLFTVRPVDDPPVLGFLPDISINQDALALPVPVAISDIDTAVADLKLSVSASPATLIPPDGIRLSGTGPVRTLFLTPASGQSGTGTVHVVLQDTSSSVDQSFAIIVSPPNTPPAIRGQPQSRTVLAGTTVTFSVAAVGTAPLAYKWSFNGTNLPSATNADLVLPSVAPAASGRYAVRVSNPAGSVVSEDAVLIVGQLGSKLWEVATGGQVRSSAAIGPDGTIYVGSDDSKIYAISPFGLKKWELATGGPIISSPLYSGGFIYVGGTDGLLYCLQTNGAVRWTYDAGAAISSSPASGRDGTVYFGADNNKLYALTPEGIKRWETTIGGIVYSSPAVDDRGNIYFGGYDNRLHAVDVNGGILWDFPTGGVVASSPAIGLDGTIYFGSADKRLYAVHPDGTRRWQYVAPAAITGSPVIGSDGTIYFGTEDGRLIAVTLEGTRRWEFVSGGPIYGTPALGKDGTIYIGSFDSRIYAINPNGSKRWEFATAGPIYSAPALDREGVLYVGSYDGRVYGIRGTTGLAETPWPMFHRDAFHSGRVAGGAVARLMLESVTVLETGGVELRISGSAGISVSVEASIDLVTWTRLDKATLTTSGAIYRDLRPTSSMQFYRLRNP